MADIARLIPWETPDRLGFGIRVRNLIGEFNAPDETFVQIDTGYAGEILIPFDLFQQLRLHLWAFEQTFTGSTISGQKLNLIESQADLIIPRIPATYRVSIQTFEGNKQFLIGRVFMRNIKLILDGPNKLTCILIPTD